MIQRTPVQKYYLYIAVCTGNLVVFTTGITETWTSPINPKLHDEAQLDDNPLGILTTDEQESWLGACLSLGAIAAPIIAGYGLDKIGRKYVLLLCCGVPYLISFIMLTFANNLILYYIARCLAGFSLGSVFTVLPVFNSEIAEKSNRGGISSSINVFETSGQMFAYSLGPYISIMWFNIACLVVPTLFVVNFFLFVPESPYYYVAKGDYARAEKSLKIFRGTSIVSKELELIKLDVQETSTSKGTIKDVFKSQGHIRAYVISLGLIAFQQFTGIMVVLAYSEDIFDATGTNIPSDISAMIIGVVQILASFVTPLVVDKWGRRMLLLLSSSGVIISSIPLGLYFYLKDNDFDIESLFWLPILCLVFYIFTYNIGFGPLPWTVMSEVSHPHVKSIIATSTALTCFILAFIITKFFHAGVQCVGMGGCFWFFGAASALATVFVYVCVIETKGKSFQEIQVMLES